MPARPWSRGPEVAPTCSSATPAKAPARGKHRSELEGLWPWQGQPCPWVAAEKGATPHRWDQAYSKGLENHCPGVQL